MDAAAKRQKLIATPEPWKHSLGTYGLTEVWALGLRGIQDLEDPMLADDVQQFAKMIKIEGQRTELARKKQAAMRPKRAQPPPAIPVSNPAPDVVMAAPAPTPNPAGLPPRPGSVASSPSKSQEVAEKDKVAAAPRPPPAVPTPVKDPLTEAFEEVSPSFSRASSHH